MLWCYDDCLYLSVGATKCYVEVNRKLGVGDGCWNLLSNTRTTMKMFNYSVFERIFLPRTIKWSMAANMQDTKFIFRTIELVIWECGWEKNIFIKHYQGESDSDAKFFFRTVELTYINNTSKSDIHVPLQHQLVHQVGVHDVQQVRIEVVHVHLVKIVKKKILYLFTCSMKPNWVILFFPDNYSWEQ